MPIGQDAKHAQVKSHQTTSPSSDLSPALATAGSAPTATSAKLRAWLRCSEGCAGEFQLTHTIYRCPSCAALLEVAHDIDALKTVPSTEWRSRFDRRHSRSPFPYGSGVWSKHEWIAPNIDTANIVSLAEGNTALLSAPQFGRAIGLEQVWIKQCGTSHTGSFKDLGMTVLVSAVKQKIASGDPVRAVVCASTGDTSAALAAYAARAEIPAVVLLPRNKVSLAQLVQPLANGARVLSLDTDFDGCMAIVQKLAEEPGIYLANSMNSLRIEGQKTVAIEIVEQLGWQVPDVVVIPGGNLGNVSALGRGFDLLLELGIVNKKPRIVVAQAAAANPLYRSFLRGFSDFSATAAQTTHASAIQIGNPVSVKKAIATLRRYDGVVRDATEQQLSEAVALADRSGFYACPHTGVALSATIQLAREGVIGKNESTVVISTASGLKFTDFKVGYHRGELADVTPTAANRPIEMAADYSQVRDALLNEGATR